jgi:hypothetical protein
MGSDELSLLLQQHGRGLTNFELRVQGECLLVECEVSNFVGSGVSLDRVRPRDRDDDATRIRLWNIRAYQATERGKNNGKS